MSRPWKHPSGVFWLRKRVPDELRSVIGKHEEKRSLQARDPEVAKVRHAQALAELETRWANLRRGSQKLTPSQAQQLAAPFYQAHLDRFSDNFDDRPVWNRALGPKLWEEPSAPHYAIGMSAVDYVRLDFEHGHHERRQMQQACERIADERLAAAGFLIDPASRMLLARAISHSIQRASETLGRYARGDYGNLLAGVSLRTEFAELHPSGGEGPRMPFTSLIEGWAAETRPGPKTLYAWRREFAQLAEFLGHDDAARLTVDDLIGWKQELIEAGLHAKTIRDAKLAAIRTVLGWAADNRKIKENVAERVTIEVKRKPGETKRGYTDEEARIVLAAALNQRDPVRRWAPWICAYTGARLSEVCQLRGEDVRQVEGIWCISFAAEAGSLKTLSSERTIPVHPALEESGFLDFTRSRRAGPIFAELPPDRYGNRGGNGTKVIGPWIRSLGLTDPRLSPSHAWRHRFRTLGRRHGLASDIVDAIIGHQRRSVADAYGEFPVQAMDREIRRIPALPLNYP
jgi:integrase